MSSMAYYPPEGETKTVKCRNCGSDVVINVNYPIDEVLTCKYCPDNSIITQAD